MPNMRLIYDNAADRASSLAASTTAGALAASNMLTDIKTEVHRSTGTSVTYTLEWSSAQFVNAAVLAFANMSSTATMRARGYTETADPDPIVDTGADLCCPYQPFGMWEWGGEPLGVNAYAYGGYVYARSYFATNAIKKLVLDVVDVDNASGYVEVGRIIVGKYWSPDTNPKFGLGIQPESNTEHKRSEAGDLRTEIMPTSRALKMDLNQIANSIDRQRVYDILFGNGMSRPVFVSVFPEDDDPALELSHQLYGKLLDTPMTNPQLGVFAASLQMKEL
jgi:hypothetical protein